MMGQLHIAAMLAQSELHRLGPPTMRDYEKAAALSRRAWVLIYKGKP